MSTIHLSTAPVAHTLILTAVPPVPATAAIQALDSESTTSGAPHFPDPQATLTDDAVQLLKDLASGHPSEAEQDLDQLQSDIKSQHALAETEKRLSDTNENVAYSLQIGSSGETMNSAQNFIVQHGLDNLSPAYLVNVKV